MEVGGERWKATHSLTPVSISIDMAKVLGFFDGSLAIAVSDDRDHATDLFVCSEFGDMTPWQWRKLQFGPCDEIRLPLPRTSPSHHQPIHPHGSTPQPSSPYPLSAISHSRFPFSPL